MEYKLWFPTPWEQVNAENDNIDVCLSFPDGRNYTFLVATPENLKALMEQEEKSYLSPGAPMLFVRKLTADVVTQLIDQLVQDNSLLNCYGSDLK